MESAISDRNMNCLSYCAHEVPSTPTIKNDLQYCIAKGFSLVTVHLNSFILLLSSIIYQ